MKPLKIFLLVASFVSIVSSQNHHFVKYKEHGFSSNQIFSLYQDFYGFLWIGTGGGLTRYDSEQYLHFSVEDSLPANEILALSSNDSSTLWIGTGLGLTAFDILDVNNPKYKFTPSELHEEHISSLLYHRGRLWIGTKHGLFIYEENKDGTYKIRNHNKDKHVKEIKLTPQNNIIVLFESDLIVYNANAEAISKMDINYDGRLKCILPITESQILLGTNNGLFEVSMQAKTIIPVNKIGTEGKDFNRFIVDTEGTFWAGTDKGLLKQSENEFNLIDRAKGLPGNDLRALLFDNEGNFWLGSYTSGLFKLSNPDLLNYNESHGLLSNVVNCIFSENEQTKLIGTDLGVLRIDGFKLSKDVRFDELKNEIIWFIFKDKQNDIWIGGEEILYIYNQKNGIKKIKLDPLKTECTFLDMFQSSDGVYWLCTTVGLFSINEDTQKGYPEFKENGIRRVWSAMETSDGRLIFCTDNGIVEKTSSGFNFITKKDGLPDRAIYQIIEDKHKTLWMASDLGIIKKEKNGYKLFGSKDGLQGTIISQILVDKNDGLWICTDKGMQKFENGKAGYRFGLKDGLLDEEFTTQNSSLIDNNGNFWLGVFGGLTVFNPAKRNIQKMSPPIYFEKAEYHSNNSTNSFSQNGIDELDYSEGNVLFKLRCLYYYNEQSLEYLYKLEGVDENWILAKRGDNIRYNNLPHGKYKLVVKTKLENHISDEISIVQEFLIKKPYWLQVWFISLVFGVIATLVYTVYYFKTKRILDVNKELQVQIDKKVKDLEIAKATIENIIEHSGSVLISTDLKGRITIWNKRAEEVFGYSKESIINKSITVLDRKDDLWGFMSVLSEVKQSGELRQLEVQKKTSENQIVDLIVTTTPLSDNDGKVQLITFSMEDFSERNRLMEFRINREKLLAGIGALNKLLATLSHYINNSIASISGMAQLAEIDSDYNKKFVDVTKFQVNRIHAVLKSLSTLVDQLNLKTTNYIGGDQKLYDIESEIASFLKSVEKISSKKRE